MSTTDRLLWAPQAWIASRWQAQVLMRVGADGHFSAIEAGTPAPAGATVLSGPVLPGFVNAHSHAFQRAFVGLAERRSGADDDFWGWRDRMYAVALRVSPEALRAVAAQLYAELLQGGYTQVCEFHYLHHAPDGRPYADPLMMSRALMQAAADTGIGLTMLPVLYERAGFTAPALRDDQRRFATSADDVLALRRGIAAARQPRVTAGVAIHSLRAARPESIARLERALADEATPIHLHVAEQTAEVDDCLAATGCRPIEWLTKHVSLDARWQLVHATHAEPGEIEAVARSGAGVVICPSTEANLGDGLVDLPGWLSHNAVTSIGSDSHVTRHWPAELRLLEYGQRLALRRRNVAAAPELGLDATAARLFNRHLAGGAAAAGFDAWGLVKGARADLLVLDVQAGGLAGVPLSHQLDALVFATEAPAFDEVWVAGERCVAGGRHRRQAELGAGFVEAMQGLWPAG
ncbi:MAG: formimidoylglutamate deiminase [Burkholderiales bacterium RIFCSPHIGHO2_12_FULL_69_20]|nr:MAG: formimidoylglutamate deiminase [Burkholderiales bacterium RIFCSPHIGHO2_12_FULL_69_20]